MAFRIRKLDNNDKKFGEAGWRGMSYLVILLSLSPRQMKDKNTKLEYF